MFPTEAGERLARELLATATPLRGAVVDLTSTPPAMLIGGFFNAFLLHVHEHAPAELEGARRIVWIVQHESQRRNIAIWVRDFTPSS
jgi:hypothetical protein